MWLKLSNQVDRHLTKINKLHIFVFKEHIFCVRVIKLKHQVVKLLRHNPDLKTSTIFSLKNDFMSTRRKSCFLKCCKEFFIVCNTRWFAKKSTFSIVMIRNNCHCFTLNWLVWRSDQCRYVVDSITENQKNMKKVNFHLDILKFLSSQWKSITIEPVILIFAVGSSITFGSELSKNLIMTQYCQRDYNLTFEVLKTSF